MIRLGLGFVSVAIIAAVALEAWRTERAYRRWRRREPWWIG